MKYIDYLKEYASNTQLNLIIEFEIVRKNALANPDIYDGRYTQKNNKEALIQFLLDRLELQSKL